MMLMPLASPAIQSCRLPAALIAPFLAVLLPGTIAGAQTRNEGSPPGEPVTIVLDASAFFDEIPEGHTMVGARDLEVDWVFNDTAITLPFRSNMEANIEIPETGTYHLFVRAQGSEGTSFKIAINGRSSTASFGDGPMTFSGGETFELAAGSAEVRITRIAEGPTFDVAVLTQNADFTAADLPALQYGPEVEIVREYAIPRAGTAKFGDVDGDRLIDFLVLSQGFSATCFNHAGEELWSYQSPEAGIRARGGFEAPGVIWDLDQDGRAEVLHWRFIEGQEWLVAADGRTGEIKHRAEWPTRPLPHDYNNFRIAIGKLTPGYPNNPVLLSDTGGEIHIAAYTPELELLWQHTEQKKKDHLGHYVYPVDLTGDGIDEVVVTALVLDAHGNKVWDRFDRFYDHHDHADSLRFGDIDDDGQLEMLIPNSEYGVVVMRALTGEVMWAQVAEHSQQLEWGDFIAGAPGPQLAVNARTYGTGKARRQLAAQVWWFDPAGNLLLKWPGNPIAGNPDFVKGDWDGDGNNELFWYKFQMQPDGRGRLFFSESVYHMFNFLGDAAEEVVTIERADEGGVLRVYGHAPASHKGPPARVDPNVLRWKMTNHTHY